MRSWFTFSFVLLWFPFSCFSHDLWLDVQGDTATLFHGHIYSEHEGQKLIPYPGSAVKSIECRNSSESDFSIKVPETYPTKFRTPCDVVLVSFSTGYWTQTPWETVNQPKTGINNVIKSWLSIESIKLQINFRESSTKPFGHGLEVTATSNPLVLKPGEKLVVVVTDQGIPVKNIPVAYGDSIRGTTDDDGKIAIRLRRTGIQTIRSSLEMPSNNKAKADTVLRSATLQFLI